MSSIEDVARAAKSLDPADRLRLIARLWASLPRDHWAAPSPRQLADLQQRLADVDPDLLGDVPWIIVSRMSANQPAKPSAKIYSAPRRFDLATIFAVTTAYAILFGSMRGLDLPPATSLTVAAFITLIGIGQAVLFGGRQPRKASIVVGIVSFCVGSVVNSVALPMLPVLIFNAIITGSVFGYSAGALVGGVFLVADAIRQRLHPAANSEPLNPNESPSGR